MVKKRIFLGMLFSFLVLVAVLHTFTHFAVFGLGIVGLSEGGISGFSIGEVQVGKSIQEGFPVNAPVSQYIVIGEWIVVIGAVIFTFNKRRVGIKKDLVYVKGVLSSKKSANKTDLDKLYELLQERKELNFKVIIQAFGVSKTTAASWAETLERGGLAEIDYPRTSEPNLILKE